MMLGGYMYGWFYVVLEKYVKVVFEFWMKFVDIEFNLDYFVWVDDDNF